MQMHDFNDGNGLVPSKVRAIMEESQRDIDFLIALRKHLNINKPTDEEIQNFVCSSEKYCLFRIGNKGKEINILYKRQVVDNRNTYKAYIVAEDKREDLRFFTLVNPMSFCNSCEQAWSLLIATCRSFFIETEQELQDYLLTNSDTTGTKYLTAQAKAMECYDELKNSIDHYLGKDTVYKQDPGSWYRSIDLDNEDMRIKYSMDNYSNACFVHRKVTLNAFNAEVSIKVDHHVFTKPYIRRDLNIFYRESVEYYIESIDLLEKILVPVRSQ